MNSNKSIIFTATGDYLKVHDILAELSKSSFNKSKFICAAILEKYERMQNGDNYANQEISCKIDYEKIKECMREVLSDSNCVEKLVLSSSDTVDKDKEANSENDDNEELLKDMIKSGIMPFEFD